MTDREHDDREHDDREHDDREHDDREHDERAEPTFEQLADARRRHRAGERVVDDPSYQRDGGAA